MSDKTREGAFVATRLMFAVLDKKTGRALVVIEAEDATEAELRADWVAPLFGWHYFDEDQLRQVNEVPEGAPTFFENFFAVFGSLAETLH